MTSGTNEKGILLSDNWLLNFDRKTWELVSATTGFVADSAAFCSKAGSLYAFGGLNSRLFLEIRLMDSYVPFVLQEESATPAPRSDAALSQWAMSVIMFWGLTSTNTVANDIWELNLDTHRWSIITIAANKDLVPAGRVGSIAAHRFGCLEDTVLKKGTPSSRTNF